MRLVSGQACFEVVFLGLSGLGWQLRPIKVSDFGKKEDPHYLMLGEVYEEKLSHNN